MVICIELNQGAKKAIETLMQSNQFRDISEAVSTALINYEVIQRAVLKGSPVTIPDAPGNGASGGPARSIPASVGKVPDLFRLETRSLHGLSLKEVPDAAFVMAPPSQWIFGQYNKFLPVKVACRALLNLLISRHAPIPLAEATEAISTEAWVLGDYLYVLDQGSGRSREDALAAAFPTSAGRGATSRIRFANQFVGDLRQPKQPDDQQREIKFHGFPAALKFIACGEGRTPLLHLTGAGAEFAKLDNPVLDRQEAPQAKFTEAETAFLLAHIQRAVPEEASAYVAITDGIGEGANTPDELDNYLCLRFNLHVLKEGKSGNKNEITQTFLTTQRTGAISRMADLGLIVRAKEGLHVTYQTTGAASAFRQHFAAN
jgi:hypothetical protein